MTSEVSNFVDDLAMIMDGHTGFEPPFSDVPMHFDGAKFLGQAKATYSPTLVALYDAMSLDQVWPKAVPFGPYYWVNSDALQDNVNSSTTHDGVKRP